MILGLTGSLGSGKSTVSSLLASCNAQVVCADRIAREVVEPGSKILTQIAEHFGPQVIKPDGSLDRAVLASQVFSDPEKRKQLESIVHPAVRERELEQLQEHRDHPLVVLDVPLLFEAGMHQWCDRVAVVTVDEAVRRDRLKRDRHMTDEEIGARLAAQMPQADKARRADFIIDNSGSLAETNNQVHHLLQQLFPAGLPHPLRLSPPPTLLSPSGD